MCGYRDAVVGTSRRPVLGIADEEEEEHRGEDGDLGKDEAEEDVELEQERDL